MTISNKILNIINPCDDIVSFDQVKQMLSNSNCISLCLKSTFEYVKKSINVIIKDDIKGDIILAGVWRGGLAAYIQSLLIEGNQSHRTLYLVDTFDGFLPVKDDHPNDKKMADYFLSLNAPTGNISEIKKMFSDFGLKTDNVKFLKGDLATTTKDLNEKISFLIVDVDLYYPTYHALVNLYSLVVNKGFIYIDDYNVKEYECKSAVDSYIINNNLKVKLLPVNKFAISWQKE